MSEKKYDVIVVGAGIAGLGVGAILSKEARQKVLVLDRFPKVGGRMMSYDGYPGKGWRVDIGLHLVELGEKATCTELNERVGKKVAWGPFSQTVDIWNGEKFMNVAELVPMTKEEKIAFRDLLSRIATMSEEEIEKWDNRSLEEWMYENVPQLAVRELLTDLGMIMTTIPHAIDMAAGEVLWIAKHNLLKVRQALQASYPIDGMDGITRGLAEVIKENGGEIRLNCDVQEIVVKDKKAVGSGYRRRSTFTRKSTGCTRPSSSRLTVSCAPCRFTSSPRYSISTPRPSPLPRWWTKRIEDIQHEVTGLIGYVFGTKEPIVDPEKKVFYSALKLRHSGFPFQACPVSNFSDAVAPKGKQLFHTDIVVEHEQASDKFERERLLALMWEDMKEMFPGLEEKLEWRLPYYVDGCDGLARQPGLVGNYKPGLLAPGIPNLFLPATLMSAGVWPLTARP